MSLSSAPPEVAAGNKAPSAESASARPRGYRVSFQERESDVRHGSADGPPRSPEPPLVGPPLPKRRKGNFFVAVVLIGLLAFIGNVVWHSFLKTQAYGVVSGRVITVSAPWDGVLESWRLNEGDVVRQGEVVASLANQELQLRRASLLDELKLTQAQLEAETVGIELQLKELDREARKAEAKLLADDAQLSSEVAELEKMETQLIRARRLLESHNISQQKYEELYYQFVGQRQKVTRLKKSVEAARGRIRVLRASSAEQFAAKLKPLTAKIETTRSELERVRTMLDFGQLRAPSDGTLARRHVFPGESLRASEPVFELIEQGSQEIVVYIKQHRARKFRTGDELDLMVPPEDRAIRAVVTRIGSAYVSPPDCLARYYQPGEHALPVHLRPIDPSELDRLSISQVVQVPYDWAEIWRETSTTIRHMASLWYAPDAARRAEREPASRPVAPHSPSGVTTVHSGTVAASNDLVPGMSSPEESAQ